MTTGEPRQSVDSRLTMVDTWLLSLESGADGVAPVEGRPGLQAEDEPDTEPPAAAMRDSSSSVSPCLARGAGSTPRRVNRSANEAKQRRAPSDTCRTGSGFKSGSWNLDPLVKVAPGYLVILVFQEAGQRLHAGLQRGVLWLHLATEARHHRHGGVQSVFVDQVTAVANETQHAVQAAGLKNGAGLPGTDQLQYLQSQV